MRRIAKVDRNQPEIVAVFRQLGFEVLHVHQLKGCFDILVSKDSRNHCIEIKDGTLPPSQRKLTIDERKFHERWKAPVHIINSVEEVLQFAVWHSMLD